MKLAFLALLAGVFAAYFSTPYMGISTFAYFLLVAGVLSVKKTQTHMKFVVSAALLDLLVVLTLQIQRSAVQVVMQEALTLPQMIHIVTGALSIVLYLPTIYLGYQIYKMQAFEHRGKHRLMGKITFLIRTISFLFMFSQLARVISN